MPRTAAAILRRKPGTEGERDTLVHRGRGGEQTGQHEHQRRRRHVAIVAQHRARRRQRGAVERQRALHGIQDRSSAGMHRPEQVLRRRPVGQRRDQRGIVQRGGDASGTARPGASRKPVSVIFQRISASLSGSVAAKGASSISPCVSASAPCHQRRGGTVAELQHGEQRLDLVRRLQMQRRRAPPSPPARGGGGVGPDDMPRGAQRDHCGIATHEADQQPLRGRQAQPRGDESGRFPGATKPVQLATTRWVMPSSSTLVARSSIAARASAAQPPAYTAIRAAVPGSASA